METIKRTLNYLKILNTKGFWVGFLTGLFYFSYIFWWLWTLNLTVSMGLNSKPISLFIILIIFLMCISVTGIFWGFFGFFAEKLYKKISPAILPLTIAATFTITEYLRSIFFSVFWYGNGGSIGPNWPLGNIAYLFVNFKYILHSSSFWGIYGINFFLMWLLSILLLFFKRNNYKKNIIIQLTVGFFIFLSLYLDYKFIDKQELTPIDVAVAQTNVPLGGYSNQDEIIKDFEIKLNLLKMAAGKITDGIVVFPEGSNLVKNLTKFLNTSGIEKYFNDLSDKDFVILDSMRIQEDSNPTLRSIFISSKSGAIGFYDKQLLVPIGEYLPYIISLPLAIINSDFTEWFDLYRRTSRGSGSDILSYQDNSIKILVCSEIIPPRKAGIGNPNIIIITGSYSIWNGSSIAQSQIISSARYRAAENRKYLVLAADSEMSYIINQLGEVEKTSNPNSYELLTATIAPNGSQTWYNYLGDWPILLISSALFGLALKRIRDDKTG